MFALFEEAYRANAERYTANPLAGMSDEELAALIQQHNLGITVAQLRQQITTPSVTLTCSLCGQPQSHLVNCKGCGGDAWGWDLEMAHGPDSITIVRQRMQAALAGGPFSEDQVAVGAAKAYQLGGCMVCGDCWQHTVSVNAYLTCPLNLLCERTLEPAQLPTFLLIRMHSTTGSQAQRQAELMAEVRHVFAHWTENWNTAPDDVRPLVTEWRGRLLKAAFDPRQE